MSDATSRTGIKPTTAGQDDARFSMPPTSIHKVEADGVQVFYREAGKANAPVVLLLHAPKLAPDTNGFIWMDVDGFRRAVAHHASTDLTSIMAAVQRPSALACIQETAPVPA